MPRRTSRKPQAARSPHPDCGRLSFAENRAPACEKGLGEGTLRQENPDSGLRRGIRASACGASADERFASIGPLGGAAGPRGVRMPHFPALKGKQPLAASRPREAATLRRTSAHRLSARTVPRRRIDRLRNRTVSPPAAAAAPSAHRPAGLFLRKSVVLHPATAD